MNTIRRVARIAGWVCVYLAAALLGAFTAWAVYTIRGMGGGG